MSLYNRLVMTMSPGLYWFHDGIAACMTETRGSVRLRAFGVQYTGEDTRAIKA